MITIEFPILKIKIKGSTYTELFNTLMQNNDNNDDNENNSNNLDNLHNKHN